MKPLKTFLHFSLLSVCCLSAIACSDDENPDTVADSGKDADNPDDGSLPDAAVDSSRPDAGGDAGASCEDGVRNGDEEAVDCGGSCAACDVSICEKRAEALYCHAFEDNAFNANPWNDESSTLALSDDAYHGDSSLAASVNGDGSQRASVEGNLEPLAVNDTYYARAYVKIPTTATVDQFDLFAIRTVQPVVAEHCALALRDGQVTVWCSNAPDFGTLAENDATIGRDRWMCVEWSLQLGANSLTEVHIDGTRVLSIKGNTSLNGPVTKFQAGIEYTSETQGKLSILVDELILDTERVGCNE